MHLTIVFVGMLHNSLQWRHNERDGVSNHWRLHYLLNCWFRCRSKKTSNLRVIGLFAGNGPVTGEFPAQKTSKRGKCFYLMTSSCYVNSIWRLCDRRFLGNRPLCPTSLTLLMFDLTGRTLHIYQKNNFSTADVAWGGSPKKKIHKTIYIYISISYCITFRTTNSK